MANLRFKCASCGNVFDIPGGAATCPKCNTPVNGEMGTIQLYRMGSPIGAAVGIGLYINGAPYGHVANKGMINVMVPYGTYKIHATLGMTRRCKDLEVTLTPEANVCFVKARVKAGFWTNTVIIEPAKPEDMPSK
ncbi:MAG: hypothetical protein MJ166_05115 [Clostridia bacterium]|nr:hypothetical protein [Clostridia bacterium]